MSDAGEQLQDDQTQGQHNQWIRKVSLIVSNAAGDGLDLSQLRIHFRVNQSDFETPNNAEIIIYNLASETAQPIRDKEFTNVTLQAGYMDGSFGIIFQGTIKQAKIGRANQTDTFLAIYAADADEFYNFGRISASIQSGQSPIEQATFIAKNIGAEVGPISFDTAAQSNIRGKVLYGMARTQVRNLADTGLSSWSFQDGKLTVHPLSQVPSDQAVVLNSQTGMVGLPEQTEDGILVRCLLNPRIKIGTQVQINQDSVQRATVSLNLSDVNQEESAFPPVTVDGFYMVLVNEIEGDTRDNDFYCTLTCLTVRKSAGANQAVKVAG